MKSLKLSLLSSALLLSSLSYADNWMTTLPDNVPVRELSIPGSHDAATGNGFSASSSIGALFSGVTQSLSLSAQWDAGVRAFDLRPAYKSGADGNLQIYHGILETRLSLKAALQTLVDKLTDSPGEMAVAVMRHESEGDDNNSSWGAAMGELLASFGSYLVAFNPDLTLGNARGKILVMSRDSFTSDKVGMISGTSHSENFDDQKRGVISLGSNKAVLYAQDFYECQTAERKYQAVTTLLDYSITHTSGSVWVFNNTSGYTGSTGTNSNILNLAKFINKQIAAYLDSAAAGRTGIMMMDFAGASSYNGNAVNGDLLVNKIAAQNSRYINNGDSGIESPAGENDTTIDDRIFDMHGRCLGIGAENLRTLPAGIYIHDRRKVIVK